MLCQSRIPEENTLLGDEENVCVHTCVFTIYAQIYLIL